MSYCWSGPDADPSNPFALHSPIPAPPRPPARRPRYVGAHRVAPDRPAEFTAPRIIARLTEATR